MDDFWVDLRAAEADLQAAVDVIVRERSLERRLSVNVSIDSFNKQIVTTAKVWGYDTVPVIYQIPELIERGTTFNALTDLMVDVFCWGYVR